MSDTAVTTRPVGEIITGDNIVEYLKSFGLAAELSPNEISQFVQIATAYQLNPFKREIYCVPYGQGERRRLSIITGYETYLKRADRIGKLKGWKAWTEGGYTVETKKVTLEGRNGPYTKEKRLPVGDLVAKIEIHRSDWDKPFEHEVYLDEYAQDNDMWASKPRTMLKKVVIAQAFRMAFPDEMGGMPYTSDELPSERTEHRIEAEVTVAPRPAEPQEPSPPADNPETAELKQKIADARQAFVTVLKASVFTDKDRETAKKKIEIGKEITPEYLQYAESIVKEYQGKLQEKTKAASQKPEELIIRERIARYIDHIPEPDREPARKDLAKKDSKEELAAFESELFERYGDLGLF